MCIRDSRILKPGESIQLCVVPLNRYGNFREEFYVYTDDGSKFAVPITQEMDDPDYLSKLVKMTPGKIKYDAAYAYYEQAPEARPITIENNSDMAVNLSQKGELGLKVGKLDKSRLEPGEKAEFTVQPAPGLSSGEYSWWVNVRAETDDGKTAYLYTTVRFMVFADNFEGVGEIPDVTGLSNRCV